MEVRRVFSQGRLKECAKTSRQRRRVPLRLPRLPGPTYRVARRTGLTRRFGAVLAGLALGFALVKLGFFVRSGQFGIAGSPRIAQDWRTRSIPDDPFRQQNVRGTVAFAWAVPNGRTTQVFINLRDNRDTHDKEPFTPFGRVVAGVRAQLLVDRPRLRAAQPRLASRFSQQPGAVAVLNVGRMHDARQHEAAHHQRAHRKTHHRGVFKVGWVFTFAAAAYNLVRLPKLLAEASP